MKSYFPDVNVWLALTYRAHQHHAAAAAWFDRLGPAQVVFCRLTQLSLLRLLTNRSVMRAHVKNQAEAWDAYEEFLSDERVGFWPEIEPDRIEDLLRTLTVGAQPLSADWADAYLAAFARSAGLDLVTFDQKLARLAGAECLLLA